MNKSALILMAHGSKAKEANEEFDLIVEATNSMSEEFEVFGAHMEISRPSLEEVISEINNAELKKVIVIPYFLFNGRHIKVDIPRQVEAMQRKYQELEIVLGSPIGNEPLMADLMIKKAKAYTQ